MYKNAIEYNKTSLAVQVRAGNKNNFGDHCLLGWKTRFKYIYFYRTAI
jgi:hypothetical protein